MLSPYCGVLGDAQQVARDLEMAVGAARSFKAGVSESKTISQLSRARFAERFIRAPAAGREALRLLQHLESVLGGPQMLFASQRDVGLHGGTESIHMAIGVFEGQHVVAFRKRTEVGIILEILLGHVAIESVAAALIREKQIFRQRVALVPGIRSVLCADGNVVQRAIGLSPVDKRIIARVSFS